MWKTLNNNNNNNKEKEENEKEKENLVLRNKKEICQKVVFQQILQIKRKKKDFKNIWLGLAIWFNDISNFDGYLMPNLVYKHRQTHIHTLIHTNIYIYIYIYIYWPEDDFSTRKLNIFSIIIIIIRIF